MASTTKKRQAPPEPEPTPEERQLTLDILRAHELYQSLATVREDLAELDKLKKKLREVYKARRASGINSPMQAPGVQVVIKEVDKAEYSVPAHREYHVGFIELQSQSAANAA